jgi:hypothetical protein
MHASVGGEVQSNPVSSVLAAQLSASSHNACCEDLADLVETLGGGHQVSAESFHPKLSHWRSLRGWLCAKNVA